MTHGPDTEVLLKRIAFVRDKLNVHYLNIMSLPKLPSSLQVLSCYCTNITELPPLPNSLQYLDCSYTQISELPTLPSSLRKISCNGTQIINLPPLPSSLLELHCYDCPNLIIQRKTGESIKDYNARWDEWRVMKRVQERCLTVKEDLMAAAWHPKRVEKWLEIGGFQLLDAL